MTIDKTKAYGKLNIAVGGRLDTTTAPELDAVIKAEIDGVSHLIIDMASLDYISSAGLRVLLSAQKVMNKQGDMVVRNANDNIKEIFEVTGFVDILTLE